MKKTFTLLMALAVVTSLLAEVQATQWYSMNFTDGQGSWTINNVQLPQGTTYVWKQSSSYGMVGNAYISGSAKASESWLISPTISLAGAVAPVLKVNHALNKGAGSNMRTKVSTNGGSTWTDLSLSMPAGSSWSFQDNTVDMTAYVGQSIQLAFVYISTTSLCPTWEIKKLSIEENGGGSKPDTTYITDIQLAKAYYYHTDGHYWDINLHNTEGYPRVYFKIDVAKKTSIAQEMEYGLYDVAYWESEKDSVVDYGGYIYIHYHPIDKTYSFNGRFAVEKHVYFIRPTGVKMTAFDRDNGNKEIQLEEETTGLEEVDDRLQATGDRRQATGVRKYIEDGRLVIWKNGVPYNAQGQVVHY